MWSCTHMHTWLRGCLIHHGLGLGLRPRTTDHGPSPTSQSPIKRLGPRTESDIRGNFFSLRFFWADRVRGKRSDRVRGPSPSSAIKRTDHGPSPWSESESLVRDLCKQPLSHYKQMTTSLASKMHQEFYPFSGVSPGGGGFESCSDQSGENRCGGKGDDFGPPGLPDPV